mgnify:CR=1 FL=1
MSLPHPELRVEDSAATLAPPAVERGPAATLAVRVSQIASPPALSVLVAFFAAEVHGGGSAHGWAALHTGVMVLCPLAYLLALLHRGQVSDVDVYHRKERWRPFLAAVAGAWASWGLLHSLGAPGPVVGVAGVLAVEVAVIFAVTLSWKISLHCATVAVVATVVWKLTGSPVALALGIPLMIWSRLLLKRHTPAQTIAGTLVGVLLVVLFFDLFAGTV